ncbi:hypothetical protein KY330_03585 [Candidatus Woesearchaeota archaeon]|nr:hypothetical protein [Candidatus Woesearchaeota archaeon]
MDFRDSRLLSDPKYWKRILNLNFFPEIKSSRMVGLQSDLRSGVFRVDLYSNDIYFNSYVAKIMGKSSEDLGINRVSQKSKNPANYAKKPYEILSQRQLAVPNLIDYDAKEGFLVIEYLPGPVADRTREGPTVDIELTIVNSRISLIKELADGRRLPRQIRKELKRLENHKKYLIKGCLEQISEVHVYATDSLDEFCDSRGLLLLRQPRISEYKYRGWTIQLAKTPYPNEEALDCLQNSYDSLRWIVLRELINNNVLGRDEVDNFSLGFESSEISHFLNPILDRFSNLKDRVVDAGDNYLHHFSRNLVNCRRTGKVVEKTFLLDWDRILYRKLALGLVQFLCSPTLAIEPNEFGEYIVDYQSMCNEHLKNLPVSSRKKLSAIFDDIERIFKDVVLLGIYESGYHGPGLGARHEVSHPEGYDRLLERRKDIDPILVRFKGDGTTKKKVIEQLSLEGLACNTPIMRKFNFRYSSIYENKVLLKGYRKVATDLARIVIDHPCFTDWERKTIEKKYDFFRNYKVNGINVSIFEYD